ncbi:MAG: armadillo-type protein [Monoraphidium minutum]|nr:MAG: armadillo-type protein [Monoraphidium minutum]
MDIPQLCGVLQGALSVEEGQRKAAEALLLQHEGDRGLVVSLLRVAAEPSVDLGVRHIAAITFKNAVKRRWDPEKGGSYSPLAEDDKAVVRDNMLEALLRAPPLVQSQMGEVFKSLVYCDYPEAWPGLLEAVYSHLTSGDELRVYGGLMALRFIARKYEFRDEEERGPLVHVITTTFPALLTILHGVIANPAAGASAGLAPAAYAKLVLKVFWSATFMGIPDALLADEQFRGWMGGLHDMLRRPPPADLPSDPEDRAKCAWVKAQKWALHISYRLFTRYANPPRCADGNDQAFAKRFAAEASLTLLEDVLALLAPLASGSGWLAPRCANLALQFVTAALEEKEPYRALKPHIDGLLLHVALPLLAFNDDDAELWADDPAEFVRKGYDILEDMYSPRTAAQNLLLVVSQKKRKAHLPQLMGHIAAALAAHEAAAAAAAAAGAAGVPPAAARRMDGALLAIGTCADTLKNKSPYRDQVEAMLVRFVGPCFDSPHGHLRAKACWVAKEFADFPFSGGAGAPGRGPQFCGLFERVMHGLTDAELPVRVDAVVALRGFVEELADLEILKPMLPALLDAVFGLMAQIDNEDLVFTLEGVVEKFGADIAPYAASLAANLAAAFWQYTAAAEDDDEDDADTAAMAAFGCIRTLNALLDSVSTLTELLPRLEEALFPVMHEMTSSRGQDVFEEVMEMASYFTYFMDPLPPRLWSLWPRIHGCLQEWAIDYWDNILPPLDNLVSRDTATFLGSTNPNYQESLFQMVSHSLGGDFPDIDVVAAPKLMEVVLAHCPGAVDRWVDPYVALAWGRLQRATRRPLKDQLVVLIAVALHYDAALTLGALHRLGAAGPLLAGWAEMAAARRPSGRKPAHFRQQRLKKLAALGLAALLRAPDDALGPALSAALPQVLRGALTVLADLHAQQKEAAEALEEGSGSDEEDDNDDDDDDDEESDGPHGADDDQYLKKLQRAARDILGGGDGADGDDGDDDDGEDDWSDEEEACSTPLEEVEPYGHLVGALAALQAAMPARYAALVGGADAGVQEGLRALHAHAEAERARRQQHPVAS